MTTYLHDLTRPTGDRLRAAGRGLPVPQDQAIAMLAASNNPNSVTDLESVLCDSSQRATLRALAAAHLGRIGNAAALHALLDNLATADNDVADQIVQAVGRIGDASAIEALLKVVDGRPPFVVRRSTFAAALIAHRHGLPVPESCRPAWPKTRDIPEEYRLPLIVSRPHPNEIDRCLLKNASDLYDVRVSAEHAVSLELPDEKWIALPNRYHFTEERSEFLSRNNIFGLIAEFDAIEASYYVTLVVLFSPDDERQGGTLHLHNLDGDLVSVGEAHIETNRTAFSVRTAANMNVNPFEIDGEIRANGITINRANIAETTARFRMPHPDSQHRQ